MESNDSKRIHYTSAEAKFPSALKSAREVSELIGMTERRLIELADAQYAPHWRIDGGEPMFQQAEIKAWAAKNVLSRCDGQELPINLRVMIDPPAATDAPASIRELDNLKQLPLAQFPPGIYFLVNEGEVVYIGQSVSPMARIAQHMGDKKFSAAYMLPVPSPFLDAVEGALIRLLRPALNGGLGREPYGPGKQEHDSSVLGMFAGKIAGLPLVESVKTEDMEGLGSVTLIKPLPKAQSSILADHIERHFAAEDDT